MATAGWPVICTMSATAASPGVYWTVYCTPTVLYSIDISALAVEGLTKQNKQKRPELKFEQMDVTQVP